MIGGEGKREGEGEREKGEKGKGESGLASQNTHYGDGSFLHYKLWNVVTQ